MLKYTSCVEPSFAIYIYVKYEKKKTFAFNATSGFDFCVKLIFFFALNQKLLKFCISFWWITFVYAIERHNYYLSMHFCFMVSWMFVYRTRARQIFPAHITPLFHCIDRPTFITKNLTLAYSIKNRFRRHIVEKLSKCSVSEKTKLTSNNCPPSKI